MKFGTFFHFHGQLENPEISLNYLLPFQSYMHMKFRGTSLFAASKIIKAMISQAIFGL